MMEPREYLESKGFELKMTNMHVFKDGELYG